MRTRLFAVLLVVSSIIALTVLSVAQTAMNGAAVPPLIRYRGTLRDIGSGRVGVTFTLYKDQQGGAPMWLEVQNVTVDGTGHFTAMLGASRADGLPSHLFSAAEARWLGIQAEGQPEQPRVLLVSVPYALKASDADTLGGKPLSAFVLADASTTGPATTLNTFSSTATLAPLSTAATITTGTTDYLPKFSDPSNLTNSSILDAAGKVGIGTATPESILDVGANSSQTVRIGTTPWSLRFGSLQSGTQFIGISVKKTGLNNNYIASSQNIVGVNHTVMEFHYDGSVRIKQQTHQPDGTVLNPVTSFSVISTGNVGVGVDKPTQKLEIAGNVKISGTANGIIFADGTVMKTASAGGSGGIAGVTAGTGLKGGGISGTPALSLDTAYTDARYMRLGTVNVLSGDQIVDGALTINGNIGSLGAVSGQTLQAHVDSTVVGGVAVTAVSDSDTGTGLDVTASATTGTPTGIHSTVNSQLGFAGIFDNVASGNILLGRVKVGEYWVKKFRVDGSGRVYANSGYATGGADFAESFAVAGEKAQYQPGDVLVIDTTGVRRLARSQQPYSSLVAGVYSTRPGVLASPYEMDDPNIGREVPLAVVGVVPCKVTAENGAIAVGDLLVTSSLPGRAMRGTDRTRMLGAVVGKALQALPSGTGVIEVLVSLQ